MERPRSKFDRSHQLLTTINEGDLVPIYCDEVLPGDTAKVRLNGLIRMSTPIYPIMDNCYMDTYFFFVPCRLLWDHWENMFGENDTDYWAEKTEYSTPTCTIGGKNGLLNGSIGDYFGLPTGVTNAIKVNALPARAYAMIYNEWFRDENTEAPLMLGYKKTDEAGNDENPEKTYTYANQPSVTTDTREASLYARKPAKAGKFHDYFTSCLPSPLKTDNVEISLTGNAPLRLGDIDGKPVPALETGPGPDLVVGISQNQNTPGTLVYSKLTDQKVMQFTGKKDGEIGAGGYLYTDLSAVTAATINDLRKAVAVQQYYEALARGGSRYREQVQALWNVVISDKTVQVPEYLGGGRYHVNINQIVQTAANDKLPLGETGAMSVTPINESSFTKSFEEHGFVIGVCCVRHNRSYQQGLERFWSRTDRLDYYVPQFANLGEQPVKKKEIMLTGQATDEETFGYQEAWADYRMKPNRVSGLMRSNASGTLDFWHYADNYSTVPTLSQDWMEEGKIEIARTLVVQNEPQFFGAIRIANKTTRRMPLYSVPGLYKL